MSDGSPIEIGFPTKLLPFIFVLSDNQGLIREVYKFI